MKFPNIRDTAIGSSVKDVFIILPIPSGHGISFIILIVIGLVEISYIRAIMNFLSIFSFVYKDKRHALTTSLQII